MTVNIYGPTLIPWDMLPIVPFKQIEPEGTLAETFANLEFHYCGRCRGQWAGTGKHHFCLELKQDEEKEKE